MKTSSLIGRKRKNTSRHSTAPPPPRFNHTDIDHAAELQRQQVRLARAKKVLYQLNRTILRRDATIAKLKAKLASAREDALKEFRKEDEQERLKPFNSLVERSQRCALPRRTSELRTPEQCCW